MQDLVTTYLVRADEQGMTDGCAAREILGHRLLTALMTDQETQDCRALLRACVLGAGVFPIDLYDEVEAALRISDRAIRNCLPTPHTTNRQ
ncbi:hypothetical protein [Streptomyces phaeochromogenes]